MKFALIALVLVVTACASKIVPRKEEIAAIFLPYVEGRVESNVTRLTAFADGPHPYSFESIGIVVEKPEQLKGKTVIFYFDDAKDRGYQLLSESGDRLVTVYSKTGEGHYQNDHEIGFTSTDRAIFAIKPNQ